MVIFQALVGCHDILILGKSPIKWRDRPDMILAVDWDVKHQIKSNSLLAKVVFPTCNSHIGACYSVVDCIFFFQKEKKDIKDRLIQMKRLATGKGKKSKHSPSDTYADGHVSHSR